MVIYLPAQSVDEEPLLDELTPREIVRELDKHVIGQGKATPAEYVTSRGHVDARVISDIAEFVKRQ